MATHSSVLAWRIPGTGEPGGLLSMGPRRLKRLSSSSISVFICKSSSESEVHSKLKVKKIYRSSKVKEHLLHLPWTRASLVARKVKNPPAMGEMWVRSLGGEDPLEEGMATHSSVLA